MRIIIYYIILLYFGNTIAQEYTPLLANMNEWQHSFNTTGDLWTDTYYTDGDTIVTNKNYYILDGYHYISRTFLMREDISEKKVYLKILDNGSVGEYLLYDFSMEVGDSIDMKNPITPFPEEAGYYTLNSIEMEPLVDGNEYRHYYLSPSASNTVSTNDAIWVEGVGSLSLITAPSGDPDVNSVGILRCAFRNAESFYSDAHFPDPCEPNIALGLSENATVFNRLQVISNSEHSVQLIHAEDVVQISIYNLQGIQVKSLTNLNSPAHLIEIINLASGLYIIDARDSNNRKKVLKFVKS